MQSYHPFRLCQSARAVIAAVLILLLVVFTFSKFEHFPSVRDRVTFTSSSPSVSDSSSYPSNVGNAYSTESKPTENKPADCSLDIDLLKAWGYNETIEYARWEISVVQTDKFQGFSSDLSLSPPDFTTIDASVPGTVHPLSQERCAVAATIEAPRPNPPVDASHLIFGVSTSLERLDNSLEAFAHWAGGTNARIIAMIKDDYTMNKSTVMEHATKRDIRLEIIEHSDDTLDRYFRLTNVLLHERSNATTEWAVIIDDDTFFPSMRNLVNGLKEYDSSKSWYIGAPTENINQMGVFGYMAYGGAGIFLSIPMLQEMDQYFDDCFLFKDTGDKRVASCIYLHTQTQLTWDHRLFQMDFQNDATGFWESGRTLPLSLHHWKSPEWFPHDVIGMSKAASVCGDNCQLKRWRVTDEWFLVNGFSVVEYSQPQDEEDLKAMEATWDSSVWAIEEGFAYSLGPLRPKDWMKDSYQLKGAILEGNRLRQYYILDPFLAEKARVIEVVWTVSEAEAEAEAKKKGIFSWSG
ncbi:hypothetical protein N7510_001493 [Penicillium lagena]|uniref:uncharacterized protein n=1 Tax=Penicillium lagena TaxID=94218 RepID=UPI00253F7F3D|nr:uncharacterized protein N7510_001493 [Penicillium lagena]KAJ5625184.1 hypothetical protein N7510_001493 [Penicillium lagena]